MSDYTISITDDNAILVSYLAEKERKSNAEFLQSLVDSLLESQARELSALELLAQREEKVQSVSCMTLAKAWVTRQALETSLGSGIVL